MKGNKLALVMTLFSCGIVFTQLQEGVMELDVEVRKRINTPSALILVAIGKKWRILTFQEIIRLLKKTYTTTSTFRYLHLCILEAKSNL
jgi:hypothetical protein